MRDTSQKPSGTLTVLGLIAIGAAPVLAFSAWLLTVVGRTMPLPGGGNIPSILAPASGQAKALLDLGMFVFAVTGAIFAIVFSLLATAITRFRRTAAKEGREPPQVYGSTQIELAWTIIPCLIVLVLSPPEADGDRSRARPLLRRPGLATAFVGRDSREFLLDYDYEHRSA